MNVLIRGMQMPKGCIYENYNGQTEYCPMLNHDDVPFCQFIEDEPESAIGIDERPVYCPLIEIKTPHGRLIDADKLIRDINKYHVSDGKLQHLVEVQPTVIEAEGE